MGIKKIITFSVNSNWGVFIPFRAKQSGKGPVPSTKKAFIIKEEPLITGDSNQLFNDSNAFIGSYSSWIMYQLWGQQVFQSLNNYLLFPNHLNIRKELEIPDACVLMCLPSFQTPSKELINPREGSSRVMGLMNFLTLKGIETALAVGFPVSLYGTQTAAKTLNINHLLVVL